MGYESGTRDEPGGVYSLDGIKPGLEILIDAYGKTRAGNIGRLWDEAVAGEWYKTPQEFVTPGPSQYPTLPSESEAHGSYPL